MKGLSVSLVIPAYNEREAIAGVVSDHHAALSQAVKELEIIVVDDGSDDGTAEAVPAGKARVIRHPANGGYGRSLRTGIEAARHEWVLMTDADGTYPAEEAARLLEFAPEFDLVIGARQGAQFWGTPLKTVLRMFYLRCARFVVGEPVPDANSGLRLARRSLLLAQGPVRCLGYSFSTTMTLSFFKEGRFIKFVPIRYLKRSGGASKVKPLRDILRTLQLMTEVIVAYNPLKLFATLAGVWALAAAGFAACFWLRGGELKLLCAVLCALGGFLSFAAGCALDSLRMHGRPATGRASGS